MSNKVRLDILLVDRGLAETRTKAQAMIMAGQVLANTAVLSKPGLQVDSEIELTIKSGPKYVSRAGLKLESVAQEFNLDFSGKAILDVGSSTGGFTDFAIQHGAQKVFAIDVGTAQLDHKLRKDERVVVMEQTDIRSAQLPEQVDMIVIDVSFISLRKVLEPAAKWLKPGGQIVAMAKPQFEASKEVAHRFKGVIKDETVRTQILTELEAWLGEKFLIIKSKDSEVAGTEGNVERFFLITPRPQ